MTPTESQLKQILDHLRSKDPITGSTCGLTPYEALGLYRCQRLAARICNLRDAGHMITSIRKTDKTGKKYAKYYLSTNKHCHKEGPMYSMQRKGRG